MQDLLGRSAWWLLQHRKRTGKKRHGLCSCPLYLIDANSCQYAALTGKHSHWWSVGGKHCDGNDIHPRAGSCWWFFNKAPNHQQKSKALLHWQSLTPKQSEKYPGALLSSEPCLQGTKATQRACRVDIKSIIQLQKWNTYFSLSKCQCAHVMW